MLESSGKMFHEVIKKHRHCRLGENILILCIARGRNALDDRALVFASGKHDNKAPNTKVG